jgi:cell division septum initiation protein DivIVA
MSLSESASAQVQAILQAAETSAAEITREAEAEAERIRSAAHDTKQADVAGLLEIVARLRADLEGLEARIKEVAGDDAPQPATPKTTRAPHTPVAHAPKAEAVAPKAAAAAPKGDEADTEGARLIALNMALNGEAREATDKYLAENFDLEDRETLLDEVYASVEG